MEQAALWHRKAEEAAEELRGLGERPAGAKAASWTARKAFYTHELHRYRAYIHALSEYSEPPTTQPSPNSALTPGTATVTSLLRRPLSPPAEVCTTTAGHADDIPLTSTPAPLQ